MTVNKFCYVCNKVKRSAGNTSTTCIECESAGFKYCVHCGNTKATGAFEKRREKVGSICKQCKAAKQKARYESDESFKLSMLEAARRYANNRYATDEAFRQSEQVRKQVRRAAGDLTTDHWQSICEEFGNICAYCGTPGRLTIDHIVPIINGGITDITNVVPACTSCNSSKQANNLIEWYTKQPFYSKEKLEHILNVTKVGVYDDNRA